MKQIKQNNRVNKITLPPILPSNVRAKAWRDCYVLVKVPVQVAVTDKRVRQWVADALVHYSRVHKCSLEDYCHPQQVGKPSVKEYHRYVRGKAQAQRWKRRSERPIQDEIE